MTRYFACYQPVVELADRRPVGWAASLHARTGARVVGPAGLFADVAPGELATLDRLGRETGLRDARGWLGDRLLFLRLLPQMVDRPDEALAGLDTVAAEAGIAMRQIVVEVGVGPDRTGLTHMARVVARCRGAGARVAAVVGAEAAVELAVVLAPDVLKLALPIVRADVVARVVDAPVLAFGVETEPQAAAAAAAGAVWGQGWYFGRPAPPPVAG